jgi:hypothetical protein
MKSLPILLTLIFPILCHAETPAALPLWEKGAPGSESRAAEPEKTEGSNVCNIHNPTITPFVPAADKSTGTAVIICPGGGHSKLCLGHEGYALAEWFRDHGIAAFVLKYRLAREKGSTYTIQDHAMADTRRAIRLIRSRAAEWHIQPDRLGILGFSAGGELAAFAAMKNDPGQKDAADPIEQQSSRPDFQGSHLSRHLRPLQCRKRHAPALHRRRLHDRPDISEGMATLYLKYKAAGKSPPSSTSMPTPATASATNPTPNPPPPPAGPNASSNGSRTPGC